MKSLVFLFFLFSLHSHSQVLSEKSGLITLKEMECDRLETLLSNLVAQQNLSEVLIKQCLKKSMFKKSCEAELNSCVPSRVKELHGVVSKTNGLSNWSAPLLFSEFSASLIAVPVEEIGFLTGSKFCLQIKNETDLKYGDWILLRDQDKDDLGAAVWISPELYFIYQQDKFSLKLFRSEMKGTDGTVTDYQKYSFPFTIDKNKQTSDSVYRFEYFRCHLDAETWSNADLRKANASLVQVEKQIANALPIKITLSNDDIEQIKSLIGESQALLKAAEKIDKNLVSTDEYKFVKRRLLSTKMHLSENSKRSQSSTSENYQKIIDIIDK